jgi:hypothetical protein
MYDHFNHVNTFFIQIIVTV